MTYEEAKFWSKALPRQPKLYSCSTVQNLIGQYLEKGGEVLTIEEGCLGYGLTILQGEGLKIAVITEVYLNEWSSAHKIRMYNKCPKKYKKMIEEYWERME